MRVRHVLVVIMIVRWSAGSVCTVRHVVFCSSVREQKVMSGGDMWYCAWCEMWVYCSVLFRMDMLLNYVLMCVPLVLF